MSRVMNFSAGPATLPLPSLETAQRELLEYGAIGASIMEVSHRGKDYEKVHNEAISLIRELTGVGEAHEVLFLQGGASQQFAQVPMNFLAPGRVGAYVVNGTWGEKAVSEAKKWAALGGGAVHVAATSKGVAGYARTTSRSEIAIQPDAAYLHFASNETIHGIQYADPLATFGGLGVPLVCDMSSDFMWRPLDFAAFDMIYAGAQKNLGPSGVVIVIAKKAFLETARADLPNVFAYRTAAENNSLYNTPPTFAIYLVRNVLLWTKGEGGLAAIETRNRAKAKAVYDAVLSHPDAYTLPVNAPDRSAMNVVFRCRTPEEDARFVVEAASRGMIGLKGHRVTGGIRASLYNAVSLEWATELASFIDAFARGTK